jgi:hypothetical protein
VRLWDLTDDDDDRGGDVGEDDEGRGAVIMRPRSVVRAHDTGVTALKWAPSPCPVSSAADNDNERLLFSTDGRQEVLAWWVRANAPLVGFGIVLVGRAPVEGEGHEVRVTAMDVIRAPACSRTNSRRDGEQEREEEEAYVVGLAHSNSVIKLFRFSPADGSWCLLARTEYTTAALMTLVFMPPLGPGTVTTAGEGRRSAAPMFLTGSTDGYLALWQAPPPARGHSEEQDPPEPKLRSLRPLNPLAATHSLALYRWRGRGGEEEEEEEEEGEGLLVAAADHAGAVTLARLTNRPRRPRARSEPVETAAVKAGGIDEEEEEEEGEEGEWSITPYAGALGAHAAAAHAAVVLEGASMERADHGEDGDAERHPKQGRVVLLLSAGADMALRAWVVVPPPATGGGAVRLSALSRAASAVADAGGAIALPRPNGARDILIYGVGIELWRAHS